MVLPQDDPAQRLATEATVPALVAAAIASDPTVANSAATMAQSTAGLVPVWKASTAYTAGQRVVAPDGDIVAAKVNFTSGATYSAANWNSSNHTVTIDNTVGRRAFAWDIGNNRAQLIYGDTGLRNIEATWDPGSTGQRVVYLRRIGGMVELTVYGIQSTGTQVCITLPQGFIPDYHKSFNSAYQGATGVGSRAVVTNAGQVWQVGVVAGNIIYATLQWFTSNPWPTTLPGVAVGTPS